MFTVFQNIFLYVALVGLAFLLPILVAKSKTIHLLQSRLLNYWRSLTPFGRIAVMSFLTIGILYGGSKQGGEKCLNVRMLECLNERKVLSYAQKKA